MGIFSSIEIAASGLTAQRLRLDVIANNLANINTTRTPEGGPYRKQSVIFAPRFLVKSLFPPLTVAEGVRVVGIKKDPSPPRMVYEPGHPDANPEGYVAYPNVNVVHEMVDMISATRAYEANVAVINAAKSMALKALEIGR